MAASAGTVTLDLDANSVKLLRELQKTQRQTQRTARGMQRSMDRAFTGIRRAARTAAAALTVGFGAQLARSIGEAGLAMERMQRGLRVATGSAKSAKDEFAFLREQSQRLGLDLETAGRSFVSLAAAAKGTSLEGQNARDIFVAISEASRVMGLSAEQTEGALTAIEQIISKGKVSAEELRGQLGERLPGAFQIAARAIGKTTAELDEMLRKGELTAEQLLPALATELRRTFGPEVQSAGSDAAAAFGRFSTAVFELKAAFAESGLLDTLARSAEFLTEISNRIGQIINTTLEERRDELKDEIAALRSTIAANIAGGTEFGAPQAVIDAQRKRLAGLEFELELTDTRLQREAEITKERERQAEIFQEIQVTARERTSSFDYIKPLSIESDLDRVLRPEVQEDVQKVERSFSLLKETSEEVNQTWQNLGFTFQSAFEDALVEGMKLRDVMKGLLQDILRIAVRKTISEPLGAFFGGIFGGFKAEGGPVFPGRSYVVGERGPELFVPQSAGMIVPNGAGGVVINNTIDARGADEARIMRIMPAILKTAEDSAVNRIVQLRGEGRL